MGLSCGKEDGADAGSCGCTCPTDRDIPFFNEQIKIASRYGLNYRECLEFIVRERHGGADEDDGCLGPALVTSF